MNRSTLRYALVVGLLAWGLIVAGVVLLAKVIP